MNKKIIIGDVYLASWNPKKPALFDYDLLDDPEYPEEYKQEMRETKLDEVILPCNSTFTLVINYPLTNPFTQKIDTCNGITRKEFVDIVVKCYKRIYTEEKKSTKVKVGRASGMYNRNRTNGVWGIWGHDLGDLVLVGATIKGDKIELSVDS